VLTSDHGEEFFEHGGFEHGHAVYQEVVAIPLVIAGLPGSRSAGSVEATPVGLLDLAPTLLAAAGAPEASLPGQDLARRVGVRRYTSRNLLYGGGPDDRYAVREGAWKAIAGPDRDPEFYDLETDPGETRDLGQRHREIAAALVENVPPSVTVRQPAAALSEPEELALRALGYLPSE
jgi:arylsulfatase A-like enzyme